MTELNDNQNAATLKPDQVKEAVDPQAEVERYRKALAKMEE